MSDSNQVNSDGSCSHLYEIGEDDRRQILKRYRKVMNWCVSEDMRIDTALRNGVISPFPSCSICSHAVPRPSGCLQCEQETCRVSVGKSSSGKKRKHTLRGRDCMQDHFRTTGHSLAVDGATGVVYCHACQDWVYALAFEGALGRLRRLQEERLDISVGEDGYSKRSKYKMPKADESQLHDESTYTQVRCNAVKPLLNLSQTCFLSAILQALLHNPIWKQYYLSSGHNRRQCVLRRSKAVQSGESKPHQSDGLHEALVLGAEENGPGALSGMKLSDLGLGMGDCMNCEMDGAFAEAYGSDGAAFAPTTMLYAMWKANSELAGYAQQDAHAFFLATLDRIHAHNTDSQDSFKDCNCIAHRTFAGSLLSTVTCARCGTSTATEDPTLDISLELRRSTASTAAGIGPGTAALTLDDCLRTFSSMEALNDSVYACSHCKGEKDTGDAVKQLSFKSLPPTLAIQLKRFEHSNSNLHKVDTMVTFPLELDMSPYMTDHLRGIPSELPAELYHYDLSAVITHEGKLDNGHYWACVRSGQEWFHLDDDKVSPTYTTRVLSERAYMLFYVKKSTVFGPVGEAQL